MSKKNTPAERLYNGIVKENPTFVLTLGMCPTLAVTTSAVNGLGMGLTTMVVLALCNLIISALRKIIPDKVRIPAFIVIAASLVTMMQLLLQGFIPSLYDSLGIYIPLIVVNCIILGRAESYASRNPVLPSLFDGIGMGLGFSVALTCIGAVREILGAGELFGFRVMPQSYVPFSIFVMAPGAFFVLAFLTAAQNKIKINGEKKGKDMSKIQSGCSDDCLKLWRFRLLRSQLLRRFGFGCSDKEGGRLNMMEQIQQLLLILISSALVSNVVLSQFLGLCPFLGVSKKVETAAGMGTAVIFVITLSSGVAGAIYKFILTPLNIQYLQTIVFILVIAALVQFVEMFLKKYMKSLYEALGVYLPLITTNCAVLGVALTNVQKEYGIFTGMVNGFATALGFTISIVILAGIREKLEYNDYPESFKGMPMVLVTAGLMAIAFCGFSGLL